MPTLIRRASVLASLLALGGLSAVAAPAGAVSSSPKGGGCPTSGRTLEQNSQVRVYTRGRRGDPVNACLFSSGRAFRVGFFSDPDDPDVDNLIERLAVKGPMVAVATQACNIDNCSSTVSVYDARTRREIHRGPAIAEPASDFYFMRVGSLVVRANGSVAWIASSVVTSEGKGERVAATEVRKIERGNTVVRLDFAGGIVEDSLALGGNRIYWLRGSSPQTARLR